MASPLFVSMPTSLRRISRADGKVSTLHSEQEITRAVCLLAQDHDCDAGQIVSALSEGTTLSTVSYLYELND